MSIFGRRCFISGILCLISISALVYGQNATLALASGSALPGGTASLNLQLSGGAQPAGVQWNLAYSTADFSSVQVTAGPASVAAAKAVDCYGVAGSHNCVLSGLSTSTIGDGVVATATFTLAAGANVSRPIQVTGLGASINGSLVPVATGNAVVTMIVPPVTPSQVGCSPASVVAPGTSSCTVTLSAAAPAGGLAITLASDHSSVTVPASVTAPAGATAVPFTATAGSIGTDGAARLMASANGGSATFQLGLVAPPRVSSLSCTPAALTSGESGACTVTLTKAAPAGGLTVALSSNNALLSVPASPVAAAGATAVSFTATAATLTGDGTALLTASANGGQATYSVSLVAPPVVSALACAPATLTAGGSATCTVTLNKTALPAGQTVAVTSTDASLTTPGSVTVGAGNSTAQFTASAGTIPLNCTAVVRAEANGASASSNINLVAALQVTNLACSPATVNAPGTSSCTVTLSGIAPAGGASILMSSSHASLTVPSPFLAPAGASSASAVVTAAAVSADETVTVTATYGGGSKSASVSLVAPTQVSNLACVPASVPAGGTASCTVTLSKAAPAGGAIISLSSSHSLLTVPASMAVAAGSLSGTFTATAGAATTTQTAVITASVSGASQTTSVSVMPASTCPCSIWTSSAVPAVAAVTDSANIELGMRFRSRVSGYVLGVRYYKGPGNTGTHAARIWTNSGKRMASIQGSNETASGWQQINFSSPVAITANTTYVVSYRASKGHYSSDPSYFASAGVGSGPLYALRDGEDGANGVYRYGTAVFPTSTNQSTNYWVDLVFNTVPSMTPTVVPYNAQAPLMSQPLSSAGQTQLARTPAPPESTLACSPKTVRAGDSFTCEMRLPAGAAAPLALAASSSDIRLPASVPVRAGQRSLTFRGSVSETAPQSTAVIAAGNGDSQYLEERITVVPSTRLIVSAPNTIFVTPGDPVRFLVTATDSLGLPVRIGAQDLPSGATFRQDTSRLEWIPAANQAGEHVVTFAATSAAGFQGAAVSRIVVGTGKPTLAASQRVVCSPGSAATLKGGWLSSSDGEFSDPSGSSLELGGTMVRVNGNLVPVLYASPERVDFQCPASGAGSLSLALEAASGSTSPIEVTMAEANPALIAAEGRDGIQGAIVSAVTNRLATVRDFSDAGEPAHPGDLVSIYASGVPLTSRLSVQIGGLDAPVQSVQPAHGTAGVVLINVRIPAAASAGEAVPVRMDMTSAMGRRYTSNTVTIAIE